MSTPARCSLREREEVRKERKEKEGAGELTSGDHNLSVRHQRETDNNYFNTKFCHVTTYSKN